MNTNSQSNTAYTTVTSNNSKTIVIHTSNGTVVKPNPQYKPQTRSLLAKLLGNG